MLAPLAIAVGTIAATLLVAVPLSLYYSWAASYLWLWFVVPTFGLPALSTLQVWGICLFLAMLRPRLDPKKTKGDDWEAAIFTIIVAPLLALGLGYAIKFWWM